MAEKFHNKYRIPSARLQSWDYGNSSAYFVTICTKNMEHYFGEIKDDTMYRNELGQVAFNEWFHSIELRPDMNLALGAFVVMPNHVHGIVFIGENKYNAKNFDPSKNDIIIGDTNNTSHPITHENQNNIDITDDPTKIISNESLNNQNHLDTANNSKNDLNALNNQNILDTACRDAMPGVSVDKPNPLFSNKINATRSVTPINQESIDSGNAKNDHSTGAGGDAKHGDAKHGDAKHGDAKHGDAKHGVSTEGVDISKNELNAVNNPDVLNAARTDAMLGVSVVNTNTPRNENSCIMDRDAKHGDAKHGVSTEGVDIFKNDSTPTAVNNSNKFGPQSKNLGSIMRGYKSAVTMYARGHNIPFAWQPRYHDHIIRNSNEMQRIENYIINNPQNWKKDKFYGKH